MALETANQKRKRGRPANASRNGEDASNSQQLTLTKEGKLGAATDDMEESDMAEETRPRKRGRPARINPSSQAQPEPEPEPEPEQEPEQSKMTKRKRGRPSLSQSQPQSQPQPQPADNSIEDDRNRTNTTDPETIQPKKRSRPQRKGAKHGTGETQETAAEEADDESENEEGDSSLLRRSGRERRNVGEWYKSPRSSKARPETTGEDEEPREEPEEGDSSFLRRKGRGRPPKSAGGVASEATTKGEQSKGGKKGRRRAPDEDPTTETEQTSTSKYPKKRVRQPVAKPQVMSEADADAEAEDEPRPRVKKRGQPSLNPPPATVGQDPSTHPKQRRGRQSPQNPRDAGEEEEEEEEEEEAQSTQKHHNPRSRPRRTSQEEPAPSDAPAHRPEAASAPSQPRKRKPPASSREQQQQPATSSLEPEDEPKPYRHLATQTRRVPRGVIEAKWGPLDAASIASVADLLATAARPVLLRLGDNPTRRAQAAAALGAVANRLRSKLARGLPFPPPPLPPPSTTAAAAAARKGGGREDELEYDRITAGIRGLEAALDPLLHSVDLLRREKGRAERELEREYRVLNTLGANARAQARERRDRLRRLHVLVPAPPPPEKGDDHDDDDDDDDDSGRDAAIVVRGGDRDGRKEGHRGGLFADIERDGDPEMLGLAAQIADHMETMRGNLAQIDGVVPAIAKSRALLTSTLLPHLGREQLEDIMLG